MRALVCGLASVAACMFVGPLEGRAQSPVSSLPTRDHVVHDRATLDSSVARVRDYVVRGGQNAQRQFLVIDKERARLFVFSAHGELEAEAPILLGAARGDFSARGIGDRRLSDIKPHEKTTPAGRFFARRGHNLSGEDVIWVDYEAGVSMHRVRATNPAERRLERLASESYRDNRISYGCINVPEEFYERQVRPVFQRSGAWVYVIPETMPVERLTADGAASDATTQPDATAQLEAVDRTPEPIESASGSRP
jgi:hypothetical protein